MKNVKLIQPKHAGMVLLMLFAAQTTQGQWVVMPVTSLPSKTITLQQGVAPQMILPTLIQETLIPKKETVVSKELWIAENGMRFHVSARESLSMVSGTWLQRKMDFSGLENLSHMSLRLLLLAVTQETTARPLQNHISGACRIQQSA